MPDPVFLVGLVGGDAVLTQQLDDRFRLQASRIIHDDMRLATAMACAHLLDLLGEHLRRRAVAQGQVVRVGGVRLVEAYDAAVAKNAAVGQPGVRPQLAHEDGSGRRRRPPIAAAAPPVARVRRNHDVRGRVEGVEHYAAEHIPASLQPCVGQGGIATARGN